jgi:hypothetical protein
MCVCNPDRSPVGINRCDTAPTPTGFAQIVGDYFPVIHQRIFSSSSFASNEEILAFKVLSLNCRVHFNAGIARAPIISRKAEPMKL